MRICDSIMNTLFVLAGVLLIVYKSRFARYAVKAQNKTWGFRFGRREEVMTEIIVALVAAGWIFLGILSLFKAINHY